jgi:antibiotic biosynthesis monooxygenase (ABM) superfamily enzyme
MVLSVTKYNIHPDKGEVFDGWVKSAIARILSIPGVVEFRAYRPVAGEWQVVTTTEFADLASWASAAGSDTYADLMNELHTLALNVSVEVWGPSQVLPVPLRPGK